MSGDVIAGMAKAMMDALEDYENINRLDVIVHMENVYEWLRKEGHINEKTT